MNRTFRITLLALFSVLSTWIVSCSMTASVEGVDTQLGGVERIGVDLKINANQSGQGQFLDANQQPIGPKFDVPTGTSLKPIPPGAAFIQFSDGQGARNTLKSFWFYSIPPDNADLQVGSGVNYAQSVFSKVTADRSLGNTWDMSRLTFKGLGSSIAPQTGTTVEAFVKFEGDRSFQSGGAWSSFPVRAIAADDGQIASFKVYFDGVLVADENAATANLASGSWGSTASVWSLVNPRQSWLGGSTMQLVYTLVSGQQISVSLGMGM